jgi:hypothetical protein
MAKKQTHKLDMFKTVLPAIDQKDRTFFSNLAPDEQKAHAASILVAMRAMSLTGDQNPRRALQVLWVNDIVNIVLWDLNKYPELQHLLMCVTGSGSTQYHPWVKADNTRNKKQLVDSFFLELYPGINNSELTILKSKYDAKGIRELAKDAGKSDAEAKQLYEDVKKHKE